MHAPIAPSSHYRSRGMRPIYQWGLVLWLTPDQYAWVRSIDADRYPDATEEQIASQDAWYEQTQLEMAEEQARMKRMFAKMFKVEP